MSIQYAKADLKMKDNIIKSVPALGTVNGEVDADSWAWGFNIGLMWTPVENLRFGLSYRSKINHNADGEFTLSDADVDMNVANDLISQGLLTPELLAGMQALVNNPQAASATISTPAWLMATAAWDVNHLLSLYATFRWTDWSSFDTHDIKSPVALASQGGVKTVEKHWQDTYLFSVGADLRFTNWWTFRAGIGYETSPVDDPSYRTAIIPDADRWWFALGSSFQATKNMQVDVSAAWLHGTGERDLYTEEGGNVKAGRFENLDAYLFGVQLVYKF